MTLFMCVCVYKGGRAQRKQRQAEEKLRPYLGRVDPGETVIQWHLFYECFFYTLFIQYKIVLPIFTTPSLSILILFFSFSPIQNHCVIC